MCTARTIWAFFLRGDTEQRVMQQQQGYSNRRCVIVKSTVAGSVASHSMKQFLASLYLCWFGAEKTRKTRVEDGEQKKV